MIITRNYANRLVRQGKATKDGSCIQDGQRYQIVVRHDLQRVDHYPLHSGQFTVLQPKREEKKTMKRRTVLSQEAERTIRRAIATGLSVDVFGHRRP